MKSRASFYWGYRVDLWLSPVWRRRPPPSPHLGVVAILGAEIVEFPLAGVHVGLHPLVEDELHGVARHLLARHVHHGRGGDLAVTGGGGKRAQSMAPARGVERLARVARRRAGQQARARGEQAKHHAGWMRGGIAGGAAGSERSRGLGGGGRRRTAGRCYGRACEARRRDAYRVGEVMWGGAHRTHRARDTEPREGGTISDHTR